MAIRKNKKFIDPRYFMDEKTELSEVQKKRIKNLLEEEIRKGGLIDEGLLQNLAKQYGVPIAIVAAIAAGVQGIGGQGGHDAASAVDQDAIELVGDVETAPKVKGYTKDLLYRGEPTKNVDMPIHPDDPPPKNMPLGRKIKESDTLGHKASQKLSRVGIAHESEDVRKEIMDMILALDTGDEQDAETLANMAAYLKDASAANVRQGLGLEEKKDHPGETCKQAHPDESHKEWEEPAMKLGTHQIDPTSTDPASRRFRAKGQRK